MFPRIAAWLLEHQRLALTGLMATSLVTVLGLTQLRIDFSFRAFVGSSDPAFTTLDDFTAAWGSEDGVLVILAQIPNSHPDDFSDRRRLEQLANVLDALEEIDVVQRSFGLSKFLLDAGVAGVLSFKSVLDLVPRHDALGSFRRRLLDESTLVPTLLSQDARATAILIELAIDPDDVLAFAPAVTQVRDVLGAHEKDGLTFTATGIPAVRADLVHYIRTEQTLFGFLTALMMIGLVTLLFRRWHGLVACGLAGGLPTALLLATLGLVGQALGILNQVYISLIPVIAVADAIHVLSRFHDEAHARLRGGPLTDDVRRAAIIAAYAEVGNACFFTTVTTSIGFLSLAFADMLALRQFGIFAALGIFYSFGFLVVGGPLMLDRVRRLPPLQTHRGRGLVERLLSCVVRAVLRRPGRVLVLSTVIIGGLVFVAKDVKVNNHLSDALGEGHATHRGGAIVDEKLAGQFSIHIDLVPRASSPTRPDSAATPSLLSPAGLRAVQRLESFARQTPNVRAVEGPALILRTFNRALTGEDKIPQTRALAEQLLFLADAPAVSSFLKDGGRRGRVIVHLTDIGGNAMVRLGDALQQEANDAFAGTGIDTHVTGIPYVASRGFHRLSDELLSSLLIAAFLIAIVLGFLFRSPRIAIISLVPNLLPLLACLAMLVVLDWTLAPTVAIVFTVALGIAVDDTIHILARVSEEHRDERTIETVLERAVMRAGRPVVLTTIILSAGFAVNTLSSFPLLRRFGAIGAAAFVGALLADVILLPALIFVFGGLRPKP